ncbi:MAG: hypothetical protein ABDH18_05235 [Aquificaceae bacterium]
MIGVLEISESGKILFLRDRKRSSFMLIKESSRENPLPEGYYVVRLLEYWRSSKRTFPYLSLVKPLPDLEKDPQEAALALSEIPLEIQKEVVEILTQMGQDISRIKNILNCIAINDRGELLWDEEPKEDEFLKELFISIDEVRRKYHEILGIKQERKSKNLQGRLSAGRSPAKRKKRRKNKPNSAKKDITQNSLEGIQMEF